MNRGVNYKPRDRKLGYFGLPIPPSWYFLLNKAYVIKWSFGLTPFNCPRGLWMSSYKQIKSCQSGQFLKMTWDFIDKENF